MRPPTGFSLTSEGSSSGKSYRSAAGRSLHTRSAMLPLSDANISNRPVTGAGGLARVNRRQNTSGSTPTHVVESVGYYSSLLQSKTDAIVTEICRLRSETEMADSESESRRKVENNFDDALAVVQKLEGDLADYNLAKDKSRSGTSHNDIHNSTIDIINRNTKLENEVDTIFISRKKTEDEISKIESELKKGQASMERKFLENDPDKLHKFQALVNEIVCVHEESKSIEEDMVRLRNKIKSMESNISGQGFFARYKRSEKRVCDLKDNIALLEDDIQLATTVDEDEARESLLGKVKGIQQQIKELDEKALLTQSEIENHHEQQVELRSELRMKSYSNGEHGANAFDHLFKKDEEVTKFVENLPETKSKIMEEQSRTKSTIEALLLDMSKGISLTEEQMPSKEELNMMKDEVTFKSKHIDANQETITRLQQQKTTRMEEVRNGGFSLFILYRILF